MKTVIIHCNACGARETGASYSGLWGRLKKRGWSGGWCDTHYCPACVARAECLKIDAKLHSENRGSPPATTRGGGSHA